MMPTTTTAMIPSTIEMKSSIIASTRVGVVRRGQAEMLNGSLRSENGVIGNFGVGQRRARAPALSKYPRGVGLPGCVLRVLEVVAAASEGSGKIFNCE